VLVGTTKAMATTEHVTVNEATTFEQSHDMSYTSNLTGENVLAIEEENLYQDTQPTAGFAWNYVILVCVAGITVVAIFVYLEMRKKTEVDDRFESFDSTDLVLEAVNKT
jgi:hypothetical protein